MQAHTHLTELLVCEVRVAFECECNLEPCFDVFIVFNFKLRGHKVRNQMVTGLQNWCLWR